MEGYIDELKEIGCQFKAYNFDIGLVDFPALINDEEVFLCWRSDEKSIRFYHEVIQEKYAFIYSLWIYNAPANSMFFYKIHDNIYLLEKINGKWLIKNVRFNGEHVLYDKEKARQIEREAIRQENLRNRRRTR